jgi:hypothetical protein
VVQKSEERLVAKKKREVVEKAEAMLGKST